MNIIGVDIGGTSIQLGVFDKVGKLDQFMEYETNRERGGQYVIEQLIKKISSLGPIDAIGVSTAGQVQRETGLLKGSVNIPHLDELPMKTILEHHFNVPVIIENDVHAAALGELNFGAGQEWTDFLFIAYGTGIGAAIIHNGVLFDGHHGFAGEVGHMVTRAGGHRCNCGLTGCYEMYGSTRALIREAQKIDSCYTNGKTIFDAYHEENESIHRVVSNWIDDIVIGLISLVHIFNPPVIILGGAIMQQGMLAEIIERRLHAKILPAFREVKIVISMLGNRAGVLGMKALFE